MGKKIGMLLKKIALGIYFFFYLGHFYSPLVSFADTVMLKSGQVVEGKIIENTSKYVKMDFDGVELTYFQEEIASVNQSSADNAARKELTSLYEAFSSSKKVVENKNQLAEPVKPVELTQPNVNQEARDTVNANSISLPKIAGGINSLAIAQTVISQLPVGLSSLPPEYRNMIKSNLEKLQPNTQETKN